MSKTSKQVAFKRPLAGAVALMVTAGLVTACGGSSNSATGAAASGPPSSTAAAGSGGGSKKTVVFVAGQADNVFYQTMEAPAKAEAAKLGVNLIWDPPSQFSAESQTPILQSMIAKQPAALIVTPDDPVAMTAPIEQYVRQNIPVITVDTALQNSSLATSAITSNNIQGGQLAAQFIGQHTHGQGGTFAMEPDTSTQTTIVRGQAFESAVKSKYPSMPIYPVQYDQQNETQATTLTSSALIAHSNIKGIFGSNNTAVEGVARAVKEAHKTGQVDIVGYDADPTEVGLLKSGQVSALIIQQPAEEAKLAVQYAVDAIEGKKSAIKKSVQLPNVIATAADANKPSIAKYYYGG